MVLFKERTSALDGEKGETMAKVMKTLVMYGEASAQSVWFPLQASMGIQLSASE